MAQGQTYGRTRYLLCKSCGDIHATNAWPHNCMPFAPARSELTAPMVITGTVEPFVSQADGRRYSCKRRYEREVRAHGCVVVGNEPCATQRPKPIELSDTELERDIKRSIETLTSDSLSNDEMANMMRHEPDSDMGLSVA